MSDSSKVSIKFLGQGKHYEHLPLASNVEISKEAICQSHKGRRHSTIRDDQPETSGQDLHTENPSGAMSPPRRTPESKRAGVPGAAPQSHGDLT